MKKLLLLLLPFFAACQTEVVEIPGFDSYVWKRDKLGCGDQRLAMVDTLIAQRDLVVTLPEEKIIRLLGQPDAIDLYVRNQKFLIYLIEENKRCTAAENAPVQARALHIRLNALGNANELYISEL